MAALKRSGRYHRRMALDGRCRQCGDLRGVDGTQTMCRPCARRSAASGKAAKAASVAAGLCRDCRSERGPLGTKVLCRPCANLAILKQAERRARLVRVSA
jgi:ribosomal protein S14